MQECHGLETGFKSFRFFSFLLHHLARCDNGYDGTSNETLTRSKASHFKIFSYILYLILSQFYQHFTSSFFVRKYFVQLFCTDILYLNFILPKGYWRNTFLYNVGEIGPLVAKQYSLSHLYSCSGWLPFYNILSQILFILSTSGTLFWKVDYKFYLKTNIIQQYSRSGLTKRLTKIHKIFFNLPGN